MHPSRPTRRRRALIGCVSIALLGLTAATSATSADASEVRHPNPPIGAVHRAGDLGSLGGSGPFSLAISNTADGKIKVTWRTKFRPRAISAWRVATATSRSMDQHVKVVRLGKYRRSAVIPHASLVTPASGDYTFVKLYLVRPVGTSPRISGSATLWIQAPVTVTPTAPNRVTVATFNVRTWNGETSHSVPTAWANRRARVYSTILNSGAGVVALQEASGSANLGYGPLRQRAEIVSNLGNGWQLVDDGYYVHPATPGTVTGLQGTRIIYDSDDYDLIEHGYLDAGKPAGSNKIAWIPWARLEQKATGTRFWVLSAHLTVEQDPAGGPYKMSELRVAETRKIIAKVNTIRAAHPTEQVVVMGDMNSTIYTRPDNAVKREFVKYGFYDAFASDVITNAAWPTTNNFVFPVTPSPHRRDYILTKGPLPGAFSFKNVAYNSSSQLASDHYMQLATLPIG